MDFLLDRPGLCFLLLLGLIVGIGMVVAKHEAEERAAFMAECREYRQNYECVAMWRDGRTRIAPVPLVIPIR